MENSFEFWDYFVFIAYALVILGVGLWVSRKKDGHQKNAEDYFLASKSLPWWAIGASLIAANISAEQFIGMSGSGFALGLAIAALAAAIVSSLAFMLNSTSAIFTMDIYKQLINPNADNRQTVGMGRISAAVALGIAVVVAPLLGGIDQAFQFIQEYTGVVSPGILAVFLLGLFWKKTTNKGAIVGVLSSIPVAMFFKVGPKEWAPGSALEGLFPNLPWMDQMGYTC